MQLKHLIGLSIEAKLIENIDSSDIIKTYASQKSRRKLMGAINLLHLC